MLIIHLSGELVHQVFELISFQAKSEIDPENGDIGCWNSAGRGDFGHRTPSVFTPANRGPGWDRIASLLTLHNSNACRYYCIAVIFQHDSELPGCGYGAALANGRSRRIPANLRMRALKKLFLLHASVTLDNLRVPPGNRLEALHSQRKGQHSIRINDQNRICFVWREGNAYDVEIVDYH